jgi:hypothetical protein
MLRFFSIFVSNLLFRNFEMDGYVQNIIQYSNLVRFTAFFFSLLAVSSRTACVNYQRRLSTHFALCSLQISHKKTINYLSVYFDAYSSYLNIIKYKLKIIRKSVFWNLLQFLFQWAICQVYNLDFSFVNTLNSQEQELGFAENISYIFSNNFLGMSSVAGETVNYVQTHGRMGTASLHVLTAYIK